MVKNETWVKIVFSILRKGGDRDVQFYIIYDD